jgi:fatty acid desaturase
VFALIAIMLVSYSNNSAFYAIILAGFIPAVYYGVIYYFGFYHCFEENDFSFKKFRESKKLVK